MSKQSLNLELYKKIYLIRSAERAIIENYPSDEMKTPMHMSMGEEAIVAGVCQALSKNDQVFGTYRSHGLYLAKTGETDKFFAEMYGKITGVVRGKGGSMHLSSPEAGLVVTSAVVASTIPVAVGAAFANQVKRNRKNVAVFFGEGALDEGVFWESLNFACLAKLPLIFVCEDNNLAVHTAKSQRQGYRSIDSIVAKFNCHVISKKTTDVEAIFNLTRKAIFQMKKTQMPVFMHFYYYRYLEHVGVFEDFDAGYRDKKEFEKWIRVDPVVLQKRRIIKNYSKKYAYEIEDKINKQIEKSIRLAKSAPFPETSELTKDVFYEES